MIYMIIRGKGNRASLINADSMAEVFFMATAAADYETVYTIDTANNEIPVKVKNHPILGWIGLY